MATIEPQDWTVISDEASLPPFDQPVAVCIDGEPEYQAYKRVRAGTEEILGFHVDDPEYSDPFKLSQPLKDINEFARQHGYVWESVCDSYIALDFQPSHWKPWFTPPITA